MLPTIALEAVAVADAELRFAASGMAVAKLRVVASNRKKNEATGQWEDDKQCWLDVTCFRQQAEHVAESVTKGTRVLITGRLVTEEWDDKTTGEKRSKIACLADTVALALTFNAANPVKAERSQAPAADDPWSTAPPPAPVGGDEAPF